MWREVVAGASTTIWTPCPAYAPSLFSLPECARSRMSSGSARRRAPRPVCRDRPRAFGSALDDNPGRLVDSRATAYRMALTGSSTDATLPREPGTGGSPAQTASRTRPRAARPKAVLRE
jgi:hypothetical protein